MWVQISLHVVRSLLSTLAQEGNGNLYVFPDGIRCRGLPTRDSQGRTKME